MITPSSAIHRSAGRLRLTIDDRIVPVAAVEGADPKRTGSILRLRDGMTEIAYAIAEPADIVAMPAEMAPATTPGPIAGVALIDGEPVEMLDPLWLFGEHGEADADDAVAPVCLLGGGDTGWLGTFIQPLLESAGYRVVSALAPGEAAQVVLTLDAEPEGAAAAPVVRLRSRKRGGSDGTIYRYDREALLGAIAAVAQGGGR